MQQIEIYHKDLLFLLENDDFENLIKKIIDLTLDTEDIVFYRETMKLIKSIENSDFDSDSFKQKSRALVNSLFKILSQKTIPSHNELIQVSNLSKVYSNHFTLGPISFTARTGEIIGLVGENGNGKTTLLRLLCKELIPNSGYIKYNLEYKDDYNLRTKLVYIAQRTEDWHGTLLTNLQFAAASYGIVGEENELLVDLIITRMGLRAFRSYNWKTISSGYKMRFELARMLLRKPKLLLIDEPLANLDIVAQQVVLDDFRDIAKSPFRPLSIVLSSQQLYEVEKNSDQVIFLKRGKSENIVVKGQEAKQIENTIIEFESIWNLEKLISVFSSLKYDSLKEKGGFYIITFSTEISLNIFLKIVIDQKIPLTYFRDISKSSRRFFI